jgi:ParB-like chromosome segregation protein Spo0J
MSLRTNPEYEKIMPKMTEEEFNDLKASIQAEGQHYPIIVNENLEVLDGHHRFRACMELDLEPDFEVRKFDDKLLEKKFVIEANLRRRNLTKFQLVELAVPLLEIEKALAKQRQSIGGKNGRNIQLGIAPDDTEPTLPKAKASEIVAKKVGVSPRTFERGKKILEEAPEEEKQKLREGKTSIAKVYNQMVSPKTEEPTIELEAAVLDSSSEKNRLAFTYLVNSLVAQGLFCPNCGGKSFECSKCHKKLPDLISQKEKPA